MADVFISYSSKDAEIANHICEQLEQRGLSCWIAPRNIVPGQDWAACISSAIFNSKVLLLIYSENSAASNQVPRELSLAEKKGGFIMPYKVDDAELTGAFNYYLTGSHWIEADPANGEYKIDEMFATISGFVEASKRNTINNTYIDKLTINNPSPMQGTPTEIAAQAAEAARQIVQPSGNTSTIKCRNCGTEFDSSFGFCSSCGSPAGMAAGAGTASTSVPAGSETASTSIPVESGAVPTSIPVGSEPVPTSIPVESGSVPTSIPVGSGSVPTSTPVESGSVMTSAKTGSVSAPTGAAAESKPAPTQTEKQPDPAPQTPQGDNSKKKSGSGLAVIAIVLAVVVAIVLPLGCFGCMFLFSE